MTQRSPKSWSTAPTIIYVERDGVIEQTNARFISEEHLRRVIDRIVTPDRAAHR